MGRRNPNQLGAIVAPLATANRREIVRRKVSMKADPERYGLSMDTRAVKDRADNREAMARSGAKLELRKAKSRGGIPVPSMRTKTNLDPGETVLPDPRDQVAEPLEQIPSPDIGLLTPLTMTEPVDLSAE